MGSLLYRHMPIIYLLYTFLLRSQGFFDICRKSLIADTLFPLACFSPSPGLKSRNPLGQANSTTAPVPIFPFLIDFSRHVE